MLLPLPAWRGFIASFLGLVSDFAIHVYQQTTCKFYNYLTTRCLKPGNEDARGAYKYLPWLLLWKNKSTSQSVKSFFNITKRLRRELQIVTWAEKRALQNFHQVTMVEGSFQVIYEKFYFVGTIAKRAEVDWSSQVVVLQEFLKSFWEWSKSRFSQL